MDLFRSHKSTISFSYSLFRTHYINRLKKKTIWRDDFSYSESGHNEYYTSTVFLISWSGSELYANFSIGSENGMNI